jgi:predicted permease
MLQDIKYAMRLLAKKPGFTILTTLVMATGIGLSVYLFSFMNTMVYKDLPFKDGGTLVKISSSINGERIEADINLHDYYEIRTQIKGLKEFGAYDNESVNVSGSDGARRLSAVVAEPNIFQLTRTEPILGRGFSVQENKAGAELVVVIGYDLWQNMFAGQANIIGQTLNINGNKHLIIGVMPKGYYFPGTADLWLPMRQDVTTVLRADAESYHGLAQMEEGTSFDEVNRQLKLIMLRLEKKYPKTNSGVSAYATTIPGSIMQDGQSLVHSMHIVAVLILILASINVGNLLLSRAAERAKETAIRVALGAPRGRLIGQLLWESIIICCLGGTIGILFVAWGLEVTEAITNAFSYGKQVFWFKFGLDAYTLKIFMSFVIATIIITGVIPAWKSTGGDFNAVLRDGTRGALAKKTGRLNKVLVVSEILISLTVLITAAIMVYASYLASHEDNGAETANTLNARIRLPESSYNTNNSINQFVNSLQSKLENNIGISDVIIGSSLPGMRADTPSMEIEGNTYNDINSYPRANYVILTSGSLDKLGVELKQGRYFDQSDNKLSNNTIIVTQSFAERHFPESSALGKRIKVIDEEATQASWSTIVGVVENTVHADSKLPTVFRPFSQAPDEKMTIAMRMTSSTAIAVSTLRKTVKSIDSEVPAFRVETYDQSIKRMNSPIRFISSVFLLFAIAAVILAASGIYGVISNTVSQRTQEIGIRRALGAKDQRIIAQFLFAGFSQLLWGGIPGLVLGSAMGYALSQVFGTGTNALVVIAISMFVIISAAVLLATYLPTKRALKMEPSEALHYE